MNRQEIFRLIDEERDRQDAKWGKNRTQHPMIWLSILVEEVGEAAEAILKWDWDNLLTEIIHVATVAVAWLEMDGGLCNDESDWERG